MFKNLALGALAIVLILAALFLIFRPHQEQQEAPAPSFSSRGADQPCPGEVLTLTMPDQHMGSLLKAGQKFNLTQNWYACNPVARGDVVYYQFSSQLTPIVRIVRAIPGDKFEITRDEKVGAWNLKVNGELVLSDDGVTPYYFGGQPPSTLSLYEKSSKGVLGTGDIIVLAAVPPGSNDSGIFGVANLADVVGKVQPVQE